MRIWSLHPKYLDAKGLVALWRETLLAKHVLEGKTKGYKNHPQLDRFKNTEKPLDSVNYYLDIVYREAAERGYHFNKEKINRFFEPVKIKVTKGQIKYETQHLLRKLETRDKNKFKELSGIKRFQTHPLFDTVEGDIEAWEMANK